MIVKVVVAPKVEKEVNCARFRVVDGALLFYSDVRMGQLLCGFKKWIRFFVISVEGGIGESKSPKLAEVKTTKKEK